MKFTKLLVVVATLFTGLAGMAQAAELAKECACASSRELKLWLVAFDGAFGEKHDLISRGAQELLPQLERHCQRAPSMATLSSGNGVVWMEDADHLGFEYMVIALDSAKHSDTSDFLDRRATYERLQELSKLFQARLNAIRHHAYKAF